MPIAYRRLVKADADLLAEFITSEPWPFHSGTATDPGKIRRKVRRGHYNNRQIRTFWMVVDGAEVGLIRMELIDEMPRIDLRIRATHRGHGLGTEAQRWLTDYLFAELPELHRLEGPTRHDNHAMRRAFVACGYTQEAHFREAWPAPDGTLHDTVVYTILRREWTAARRAEPA
ncbi:MAG TPA: GNAT family protein [Actinocrinis sp.]|jgi:RimJ/RimL family protein N-acetyltransferase|uniref:GNAT family N-acetyltransferase n=1 Tax=Actinocrinis sp. TaxID=1920516 RepID=UPI002DDD6B1A|nr:GNAT family protein [Actinocrinis sp.]HEV3172215.1 GNAT family protein [Actinocrinis sp.]